MRRLVIGFHRLGADFEINSIIFDSQYLNTNGPYLWTTEFPNVDLLAPSLTARLEAEKYFTGWNTLTGGPGPAAVKVGIMEPDDAVGSDLAADLTRELQAEHVDIASTFLYQDSSQDYGSEMSSAVLRFEEAKVTHVINIPPISAAFLLFSEAASSQHYHPRYGLTSYSIPNQDASDLPAGQLNGAVGVGFDPAYDVNTAQAPAPDAAAQFCNAALRKADVSYTSQLAIGDAWSICDAFELFADAATAGQGFSQQALSRGMALVGSHFAPADAFGSALSASNHSVPGSVRDIVYSGGCACYSYSGPDYPLGPA